MQARKYPATMIASGLACKFFVLCITAFSIKMFFSRNKLKEQVSVQLASTHAAQEPTPMISWMHFAGCLYFFESQSDRNPAAFPERSGLIQALPHILWKLVQLHLHL